MKTTEAITLQSLALAVSQLNLSLPEPMHQAVRQLGERLATTAEADLGEVAREAQDLVRQDPDLQAQYLQMRDRLTRHYNAKSNRNGRIANMPGASLTIQSLLAQVLANPDRHQVKQAVSHCEQVTDDDQGELKTFLDILKDAIFSLDSHAKSVLKLLESQPLPAKEMAVLLNLPFDRLWTIVQNLWKYGYIVPVNGHWLYLFLPDLAHRLIPTSPLTPETYLTTTFKGQFALYPFVTTGHGS